MLSRLAVRVRPQRLLLSTTQRCFSSRALHVSSNKSFQLALNTLEFATQTVYAGTEALVPATEYLAGSGFKRPLIVSDKGVFKAGIVAQVEQALTSKGLQATVFSDCHANPGVLDVQLIAKAFLDNNCDCCVGVGGGGPLDAAKGAMALVARKRISTSFDLTKDTGDYITNTCRKFGSSVTPEFLAAVPQVIAIPTTAGTGSDGGKSAVITDSNGVKVVFGHPVLMPKIAALVPQFTAKLPHELTVGTGVDALFHCLEPLFCPTDIMIERDGMTQAEIDYCDGFSIHGMELVYENLPKVVNDPENLHARLNMQIAALYGAKAFRKGDLGGVHATAHAVGSKFHLHHGACVGRMAVPVIEFNEDHLDLAPEGVTAADAVRKIFGGRDTMHQAVEDFLRSLKVPLGLSDIVEWAEELDELAQLAENDACQTNPIPLSKADYREIFDKATKMPK